MARGNEKSKVQAIIFDTDILIWYFRGHSRARDWISRTEKSKRWISSLTVMELMQGCRNQQELLDCQSFIAENISRIIHPRTSISEKAIHLIGEYSRSNGLKVIDALIASSCLLHRALLVTGNGRHFKFIPGLKLRVFEP